MADLTVMGAGIFGLSIAFEAARRGARVEVIDPAGPGDGASGGLVGALAPHAPDSGGALREVQFAALCDAPGFWQAVEAAGGKPSGYGRIGRVQPLADAAAVARARARGESAVVAWHGRAVWRVRPVAGSWEPDIGSGLVVEDTLSARVHPRQACAALAAAVRALGGNIVPEGGISGPVIWATGAAGLLDLSAALGWQVGGGEKGQALALAHDPGPVPMIQAPGLYIVPHADGTVAVGSTSERTFADPTATDAQLDALHARAVALCPALAGAPIVARWAGERPRTASRHPILDAWPGRPGHFVANGGFKIGFGLAPWVGRIAVDLVLEGRDAVPEPFRLRPPR
ncbi:MAG: NAD(P)/FAD-dependent oxidoreductase [Gemmobacter sp.]